MFHSVSDMRGYTICAQDGTIGHVDQFLFDDRTGNIRYLVVRLSGWLLARRVLIELQVLRMVSRRFQTLDVALTKRQIEDSPDIETNPPVPQQCVSSYFQRDPLRRAIPSFRSTSSSVAPVPPGDGPPGDPHLHSTRELIGYRLKASDGAIGRIVDFIVDDTTWAIRSMAVEIDGSFPGKRVLLPWQRIEAIRWVDSAVEVGLPQATVRRHPMYESARLRQRGRASQDQRHP